MQKMKHLGLLGILLISVVMLVAGMHFVCEDQLFFYSDLWSLSVYLGSTALVMCPLFLLGMFVSRWLPERMQTRLVHGIVLMFTAVIAAVFLRLALGYVADFEHISWQCLVCFLLALLWVYFGVNRQDLVHRTQQLGLVGFVLIGFVPLMIGWNHLGGFFHRTDDEEKHLVMIVLDGFPAHYLHSYNPETPTTPFDETLKRSHLLREVRTSAPYTHRFFGQLYTGRLTSKVSDIEPAVVHGNLFASLQENRVKTRLVSFHRNGFPEGCRAHIDDYRGLRSEFLTENYTWIPDLLGLDYHITFNWPLAWFDTRLPTRIRARGRRLLNGGHITKFDNVLTECLLPEMRQMRRHGGSTFLLFHIRWAAAGYRWSTEKENLLTSHWKRNYFAEPARLSEVRSASSLYDPSEDLPYDPLENLRYDPAIEPLLAIKRKEVAFQVGLVGESLNQLLAELQQDDSLGNTRVILTSDHGSIYRKGKLRYSFHPNQEVVKVACAVLGTKQQTRIDDRRFCTPDLTASILDYHGIECRLHEEAISIFSEGSGRDFTAALTEPTRGDLHEWWLVIVREDLEYWFNLDPEGEGEAITYQVNTFNEIEIPPDQNAMESGPSPEMIPIIRKTLDEFGVSKKVIHPAYH